MVSREFPGSILERCNQSKTEKQSDMKDMSLNSVSWIQAESHANTHRRTTVWCWEKYSHCVFRFPQY